MMLARSGAGFKYALLMPGQVVEPSEVADLLRRTAELQHDLAAVRRRLEADLSPLSVLAAVGVEHVEEPLGLVMKRLQDTAALITAPSAD